jgi:hypothetical protein
MRPVDLVNHIYQRWKRDELEEAILERARRLQKGKQKK